MNKNVLLTIGVSSGILMLIALFVVSTLKEHGDTNAAVMYEIVYFIPVSIICSLLTVIYSLAFERYQKGRSYKFIFLITFSIMSLLFVFDVILGITSLVGFLTAYVIWHIKILDEK